MRYQIRTIMLVIAGLAAPIYAATEASKAGCLPRVALVWGLLVAAPLGLMGLLTPIMTTESGKDRTIALFGALAFVGYFLAIGGSLIVIGLSRPWFLRAIP